MADDKPFECTKPGCDMVCRIWFSAFTNCKEDIYVHQIWSYIRYLADDIPVIGVYW